MITNSVRAYREPDIAEKFFMERLVELEEQLKYHRCQLIQLKRFMDRFEQLRIAVDRSKIRRVRQDNTIVYKGRTYLVPVGTYLLDIRVDVYVKERLGFLMIIRHNELLALHLVGQGKPARDRNDPPLPPF